MDLSFKYLDAGVKANNMHLFNLVYVITELLLNGCQQLSCAAVVDEIIRENERQEANDSLQNKHKVLRALCASRK